MRTGVMKSAMTQPARILLFAQTLRILRWTSRSLFLQTHLRWRRTWIRTSARPLSLISTAATETAMRSSNSYAAIPCQWRGLWRSVVQKSARLPPCRRAACLGVRRELGKAVAAKRRGHTRTKQGKRRRLRTTAVETRSMNPGGRTTGAISFQAAAQRAVQKVTPAMLQTISTIRRDRGTTTAAREQWTRRQELSGHSPVGPRLKLLMFMIWTSRKAWQRHRWLYNASSTQRIRLVFKTLQRLRLQPYRLVHRQQSQPRQLRQSRLRVRRFLMKHLIVSPQHSSIKLTYLTSILDPNDWSGLKIEGDRAVIEVRYQERIYLSCVTY